MSKAKVHIEKSAGALLLHLSSFIFDQMNVVENELVLPGAVCNLQRVMIPDE